MKSFERISNLVSSLRVCNERIQNNTKSFFCLIIYIPPLELFDQISAINPANLEKKKIGKRTISNIHTTSYCLDIRSNIGKHLRADECSLSSPKLYTWPTTITTTTKTTITTTKRNKKNSKKYPQTTRRKKKFTFNIPLEKQWN